MKKTRKHRHTSQLKDWERFIDILKSKMHSKSQDFTKENISFHTGNVPITLLQNSQKVPLQNIGWSLYKPTSLKITIKD